MRDKAFDVTLLDDRLEIFFTAIDAVGVKQCLSIGEECGLRVICRPNPNPPGVEHESASWAVYVKRESPRTLVTVLPYTVEEEPTHLAPYSEVWQMPYSFEGGDGEMVERIVNLLL